MCPTESRENQHPVAAVVTDEGKRHHRIACRARLNFSPSHVRPASKHPNWSKPSHHADPPRQVPSVTLSDATCQTQPGVGFIQLDGCELHGGIMRGNVVWSVGVKGGFWPVPVIGITENYSKRITAYCAAPVLRLWKWCIAGSGHNRSLPPMNNSEKLILVFPPFFSIPL